MNAFGSFGLTTGVRHLQGRVRVCVIYSANFSVGPIASLPYDHNVTHSDSKYHLTSIVYDEGLNEC